VAPSTARRWWTGKVGRFLSFVFGRVSAEERAELGRTLTPAQAALFAAMPRADQRHGLDVASALRRAGFGQDHDLIVAGLLHDAGKGPTVGLWHRITWSLGQRYGFGIVDVAARLPGARPVFDRLRNHARLSAELARDAGASERTVDLIGEQADPQDPAARVLQLADEGELAVRP
jgi:hypothetical protein